MALFIVVKSGTNMRDTVGLGVDSYRRINKGARGFVKRHDPKIIAICVEHYDSTVGRPLSDNPCVRDCAASRQQGGRCEVFSRWPSLDSQAGSFSPCPPLICNATVSLCEIVCALVPATSCQSNGCGIRRT